MSQFELIPCSIESISAEPCPEGCAKMVELRPQSRPSLRNERISEQVPGLPTEAPRRGLQLVRTPMVVERPVGEELTLLVDPARPASAASEFHVAALGYTPMADVPTGWNGREKAGVIAGLALLAGSVSIGWWAIPNTEPVNATTSAAEICAAFRPFGVTETAGTTGLGGARSHGCRTASRGDGPNEPERLSLEVTAAAGPDSALESVEMGGQYRPRGARTDLQREMLWAASSVFTRLEAEVPTEVLEGIEQPSVKRLRSGGFDVGITHVCDTAAGLANARCRVALSIRRAP